MASLFYTNQKLMIAYPEMTINPDEVATPIGYVHSAANSNPIGRIPNENIPKNPIRSNLPYETVRHGLGTLHFPIFKKRIINLFIFDDF